jgi:uncharacterized SAM-binding protein YcdF (DUF218 family)
LFFILSKILDVFLEPLAWAVFFVVLSIPWRRRDTRRWRRRRAFAIAGLAVLLVCAFEPVSNGLLYGLERSETSTYRADTTYDVVVLLGGVADERIVFETGEPAYNENVERLTATYRLLREGKARHAIISGGAVDPKLDAYAEARVLAKQLVDWGIDPERVIVEAKAMNTHENAVFSKRIIDERGFKSVVVVTSAFHMRRSAECFVAVGLRDFDTLAVDYRAYGRSYGVPPLLPRAHHLYVTTAIVREVAGRWIYRLQGYGKPR